MPRFKFLSPTSRRLHGARQLNNDRLRATITLEPGWNDVSEELAHAFESQLGRLRHRGVLLTQGEGQQVEAEAAEAEREDPRRIVDGLAKLVDDAATGRIVATELDETGRIEVGDVAEHSKDAADHAELEQAAARAPEEFNLPKWTAKDRKADLEAAATARGIEVEGKTNQQLLEDLAEFDELFDKT